MQLIYFILLWLYMGETARVKMDADEGWELILLYLFAPTIHISILLTHGFKGYLKKDWKKF